MNDHDKYKLKLESMTDEELFSETYDMIYQSARCNNNPKACWHWMVDACYDECVQRSPDLYGKAWSKCYNTHCS